MSSPRRPDRKSPPGRGPVLTIAAALARLDPERRPLAERLLDKVWESGQGHWLWCGRQDRNGYGYLVVEGRDLLVHRLAYELFVRPLPAEDRRLFRRCGHRRCLQPAHLRLAGSKTWKRNKQ